MRPSYLGSEPCGMLFRKSDIVYTAMDRFMIAFQRYALTKVCSICLAFGFSDIILLDRAIGLSYTIPLSLSKKLQLETGQLVCPNLQLETGNLA